MEDKFEGFDDGRFLEFLPPEFEVLIAKSLIVGGQASLDYVSNNIDNIDFGILGRPVKRIIKNVIGHIKDELNKK